MSVDPSEHDVESRRILIEDRWQGFDGAYGGYLLALFADEACRHTDRDLVSLHCVFSGRVRVGEAELRTGPSFDGRRTSSRSFEIRQSGTVKGRATVVSVPPSRLEWIAPAGSPPPPDHFDVYEAEHAGLPYASVLEQRAPDLSRFDYSSASWTRLREPYRRLGMETPYGAVAFVVDHATPALFATDAPPLFVPTIEFDLRFVCERDLVESAADGWMWTTVRSDWASKEYVQESATLAALDGRTIAHLRQLRAVISREEGSS